MINPIAPHGPPTQTLPDRPSSGGKGGGTSFDDLLPGKSSPGIPSPIEDHSPPPTLPEDTGDEQPPEPILHRPIRLKNATGSGPEPLGTDAARAAMLLPIQVDPRQIAPAITLSPDGTSPGASEPSASSDDLRTGSAPVGTASADVIRSTRDPLAATDRVIRPGSADGAPGAGSGQVLDEPPAATDEVRSEAADTGIPVTDWIRTPYSSGAQPEVESTAITGPVTTPVVPGIAPLIGEMPDLPPKLAPIIRPFPTSRMAPLSTGSEAPRASDLSDALSAKQLSEGTGSAMRSPGPTGEMDPARTERMIRPRVEIEMSPGVEANAPADSSTQMPEVDSIRMEQAVPSSYSISTSRAVLSSLDSYAPVVPPVPNSQPISPDLTAKATPDHVAGSSSTTNLPIDPSVPTVADTTLATVKASTSDTNSTAETQPVPTPRAENSGSSDEKKAKIAGSALPEIRTARTLENREVQAAVNEGIKSRMNSGGTPVAKEGAVVTATSPTEEKEMDLRPLPKRGTSALAGAFVPARRAEGGTLGGETLMNSAVSGVTTSSAPTFQVAGTATPDGIAARQVVKVETLLQNALNTGEGLRPNGQSHLEMRVSLGNGSEDVTVRMQVANDRMQVTFQTDSPEMRKALEHGWEQFSAGSAQSSTLSLAQAQFEPGRAFTGMTGGQTDTQSFSSGQQNSRRQDDTAVFAEESGVGRPSSQPGRTNNTQTPTASRGANRRWSGWA